MEGFKPKCGTLSCFKREALNLTPNFSGTHKVKKITKKFKANSKPLAISNEGIKYNPLRFEVLARRN